MKAVKKENDELIDESVDIDDTDIDVETDANGETDTDVNTDGDSSSERIRKKHATTRSKALFKAIDILWANSQNSCPYVTKRNAATIDCVADDIYDVDLPDVCRFDMYRVKTDERQPAIILIHGGGFTAGDKKYRKGQSQFFALNGFTVFCVNYGLATAYTFPEPVKHVIRAANYVYSHADDFNIDPERIIVAGDSAGAYYAAMLASCGSNKRFKELFGEELEFPLLGALLNCGLYDMRTVMQTKYAFDVDDGVFLNFTGLSKNEFNEFEYKDCCMPFDFIDNKFPPTFVIYSKNDTFCKGQGEAICDRLEKQGVYYEFYKSRHVTAYHCFSLTWRGEDASAANELMLSFAKRLAAGKIKL